VGSLDIEADLGDKRESRSTGYGQHEVDREGACPDDLSLQLVDLGGILEFIVWCLLPSNQECLRARHCLDCGTCTYKYYACSPRSCLSILNRIVLIIQIEMLIRMGEPFAAVIALLVVCLHRH